MRIRRATPDEVRYSCLHFHYAKRVPAVQTAYSVFTDAGEFCGTVCYGSGASPQIGKPYGLVQGEVCELLRVALNGKQGHGHTSEAVGKSLKQLHRDRPLIRLVVSYADQDQGHLGKIYQATNWIYTGEATGGAPMQALLFGEPVHNVSIRKKYGTFNLEWLRENVDPHAEYLYAKGKYKYLYPLDKRMRRQIGTLAKPYPEAPSEG